MLSLTLPTLFAASLSVVFVPKEFDTNDRVVFAAEGALASSCLTYRGANASIDVARKRIHITSTATPEYAACSPTVKRSESFQSYFEVGQLPEGVYQVSQGENNEVIEEVTIRAAKSDSIDDVPYAPVEQVEFKGDVSSSGIRISGRFDNSCDHLTEMPVKITSKVILVEPVMAETENSNCQSGSYPFEAFHFLDFVPPGRYLLHVRSHEGASISQIVEVK